MLSTGEQQRLAWLYAERSAEQAIIDKYPNSTIFNDPLGFALKSAAQAKIAPVKNEIAQLEAKRDAQNASVLDPSSWDPKTIVLLAVGAVLILGLLTSQGSGKR